MIMMFVFYFILFMLFLGDFFLGNFWAHLRLARYHPHMTIACAHVNFRIDLAALRAPRPFQRFTSPLHGTASLTSSLSFTE